MDDSASNRKAFAQRVKRLRVTLSMSQDDLADAVGVRRQTISLWEAGKTEAQDLNLARFEALEQGATARATPKRGPSGDGAVRAVFLEGAEELRTWLHAYTGRVLHAQADDFEQLAPATPVVADETDLRNRAVAVAEAMQRSGADAQTPAGQPPSKTARRPAKPA